MSQEPHRHVTTKAESPYSRDCPDCPDVGPTHLQVDWRGASGPTEAKSADSKPVSRAQPWYRTQFPACQHASVPGTQ